MKAYLLHGAEDIRLADRPHPEPETGQVVIETRFTGICGSDIHYYKHGYCGRFIPKRPFALGHEISGVVSAVGSEVQELHVGDEVAIDPSMPCGQCEHCLGDHYNLCTAMKFLGSASCDPHMDGGQGQFVVVPAKNCHVLPQGISLSQASLLEPLCVAMHAVKQVSNIEGASVLITGGGPIGQLALRVAQAFGAVRVSLSDIDAFAREFAMQSGAHAVINPLDKNAWDGNEGYDLVFEASGAPAAMGAGLEIIKRGGTLVQIGSMPEEVTIPANLIMTKELRVQGSFRYANVFEPAIAMVAAGQLNLDGIISETYGFDEIPEAMKRALHKDRVVKVQVAI
jgi:L-idonate 5-dehydrogenase